ncbi:MAG: peptide chain release factor N(5)-glutamine methyltransferase [Polyangiaceae bacterium]|nr:peptide chain release factor N(5)-glutamine methyltransferase [Polyangiaceae bacterium]
MTDTDAWTIRRVLTWAADDLRTRGTDTPRLDAEILLAHVLGSTRLALITDPERPLSKEELTAYRELHKRRRAAEPVAYLVGQREFYGRPFRVDKRVLVPRPDTETLVDVALERLAHLSLDARVLDLCTGSGCVAITLACERPTWTVMGTDLSEDALTVARDNAARLGAQPRAWFRRSDLFSDLGEAHDSFDLITANPPYIPESERSELARTIVDFEPHMALFGGNDGLDVVRAIIDGAPAHLEPSGVLAMEIGYGQAQKVAELMRVSFDNVEIKKDYGGIERVVSGVVR